MTIATFVLIGAIVSFALFITFLVFWAKLVQEILDEGKKKQ